MKKLFFTLLLLASVNCFAGRAKPETGPLIYSVLDLNSGSYLEQSNVDKVHSIASLTKLMTAYVLVKNHPDIDACSSKVTENDRDWLKFTKTRIEKDELISCKKMLQAMLVMSDNGAASALSKSLPDTTAAQFIQLMNNQAHEWGMKMTSFKDSSGLSPENKSTASNLNILISKVSEIKLIKELSTQKDIVMVKTNGHMDLFKNTNRLIRENTPAFLSKTGYIRESGYNLIFVPKDCQSNIALLIMGAKSSAKRANFAEKILNKYRCG